MSEKTSFKRLEKRNLTRVFFRRRVDSIKYASCSARKPPFRPEYKDRARNIAASITLPLELSKKHGNASF